MILLLDNYDSNHRRFYASAGIVADSGYREMLQKAKALFAVVEEVEN